MINQNATVSSNFAYISKIIIEVMLRIIEDKTSLIAILILQPHDYNMERNEPQNCFKLASSW